MPDEFVNMITQLGFHFGSPNFQDGFDIALTWMVLQIAILVNTFMLVRNIISVRGAR